MHRKSGFLRSQHKGPFFSEGSVEYFYYTYIFGLAYSYAKIGVVFDSNFLQLECESSGIIWIDNINLHITEILSCRPA